MVLGNKYHSATANTNLGIRVVFRISIFLEYSLSL